jgi:hypothetical protein
MNDVRLNTHHHQAGFFLTFSHLLTYLILSPCIRTQGNIAPISWLQMYNKRSKKYAVIKSLCMGTSCSQHGRLL